MVARRSERRKGALLLAGWCAAVLFVLAWASWARTQEHESRRPPRYPGPGGGPSFQRGYDEPADGTLNRGFVFVDGEYLSPPYELRETEEAVFINEKRLQCVLPEGESFRGGGPRGDGPRGEGYRADTSRGSGMMRGVSPVRRLAWSVRYQLESNGVVLAIAGQPMVALDGQGAAYELFKLLLNNGEPVRRVSLVKRLPEGLDRDVWNDWLDDFQAPESLRTRAASLIATYDASEQKAMSAIAATQRLNALAYPLTLGGFVVTVLAVGHLLGGRPHAGKSQSGQDATPEMLQAFHWTLALIALMSVLDLAWTILAAQAGQMRELNPFGSNLVENPRQLIGFKVGATFPSLALLWLLRKYKRAQIGAWWICLLLTVLAFRWLAFNSSMIST